MSQQLTVQYGLKTFKVKTTPSMSLKDVCNKAIDHYKLDPTANYALSTNKTKLDLMLPMRLANLPQGCKLTLTVLNNNTPGAANSASSNLGQKSANDQVNIKLQVSGDSSIAAPLILKLSPDCTMIQMLAQFETQFNVKLNGKSEFVTKKHIGSIQTVQINYRPLLQVFTTTIVTQEDLAKKLRDFGISNGNVVFRLSFQKFEEKIVSEESVPVEEQEQDQEELLKAERDDLNDMVEKEILERKEKEMEMEMEIDQVQGQNAGNNSISTMVEPGDDGVASSPDPMVASKIPTTPFIATPRLFNPAVDKVSTTREEDKAYEMSVDQAKLYHKMITNSGLNDRTRQKLNMMKKQPIIKIVSVRIKFPDRSILELNFDINDTIDKLFTTLRRDYLENGDLKFELYQSYPHRLILPSEEVLMLNLLGLKNVLLLETSQEGPFLKQGIGAEKLDYQVDSKDSGDEEIASVPQQPQATAVGADNSRDFEKPKSEKKVPKWFKMGK